MVSTFMEEQRSSSPRAHACKFGVLQVNEHLLRYPTAAVYCETHLVPDLSRLKLFFSLTGEARS